MQWLGTIVLPFILYPLLSLSVRNKTWNYCYENGCFIFWKVLWEWNVDHLNFIMFMFYSVLLWICYGLGIHGTLQKKYFHYSIASLTKHCFLQFDGSFKALIRGNSKWPLRYLLWFKMKIYISTLVCFLSFCSFRVMVLKFDVMPNLMDRPGNMADLAHFGWSSKVLMLYQVNNPFSSV